MLRTRLYSRVVCVKTERARYERVRAFWRELFITRKTIIFIENSRNGFSLGIFIHIYWYINYYLVVRRSARSTPHWIVSLAAFFARWEKWEKLVSSDRSDFDGSIFRFLAIYRANFSFETQIYPFRQRLSSLRQYGFQLEEAKSQ